MAQTISRRGDEGEIRGGGKYVLYIREGDEEGELEEGEE